LIRKRLVSVIILALVVITVIMAGGRIIRPFASPAPIGGRGNAVALIYLEGMIVGGRGQNSLLNAVGGTDTVIRQLQEARLDPDIAAVVLRINSPGGTAAASQEVHNEVLRVREAGKPLVASFADVAASGGYWIASGADAIVANPATITGSIGVIMEVNNLVELYEKLGIGSEVIKSGEHKDMGNPARSLTENERDILQSMVDDIFEQFIDVVAEGRGLGRAQVRELADGRIFTGRQAEGLGLVDRLGDLTVAVDLAGELAEIPGKPRIKEMGGRRSVFDIFFGGTSLNLPLPSSWPLKSFNSRELMPR